MIMERADVRLETSDIKYLVAEGILSIETEI